jgi:hypothetical protein
MRPLLLIAGFYTAINAAILGGVGWLRRRRWLP